MSRAADITGKIGFLSLGDILQLIGSVGGTGILYMNSKYAPDRGEIYFIKGDIINALNNSETGLKALYSLFGWADADFEFLRENVEIKREIRESRMALIMDGLRMVDDGSVKYIGPPKENDDVEQIEESIEIPLIKGGSVDYLYVAAEEEFYRGQQIFKENTHGDWIWIILEGTVSVIKETSKGTVRLVRLGEGTFIGSINSFLFKNSVRNTTVVAEDNVQLGILDVQRLAREYADTSPEFRKIVKSLDNRLRQVIEKTVEIYLKKENPKDFLNDKKELIKQGDEHTKFSMLKQGDAFIIRDVTADKILLAQLGKDDFIGRLPFPDIDAGHEPESASVFISDNTESSEPDIESLITEYKAISPMLRNIIRNIASCIEAITHVACEIKERF